MKIRGLMKKPIHNINFMVHKLKANLSSFRKLHSVWCRGISLPSQKTISVCLGSSMYGEALGILGDWNDVIRLESGVLEL